MKIKDLLKDFNGLFHTISPDQSVGEGIKRMSAYNTSALLVMTGEASKGIFTERDLVRCHILFPDKNINDILIKKVMTGKLIVAEPEDTIDDAMRMMIKGNIRHLPIVSETRIINMFCLEDLVHKHVGALTKELHYLKDYISDLQDAAHD